MERLPPPVVTENDFDELLAELTQSKDARRREYGPGDVVFRQGEDSYGMFIVRHGWLKVMKTSPDGREQTLQTLGPGDIFNSLSLFVAAPNPATAVALEPTVLWHIPGDIVVERITADPQLAWRIIRLLASRLLHLTNLVEDLSLRTVEGRLARLLLEQADNGVIDRRRWATQTEIAARMGTVPDVLNRTLRSLEKSQLIRVERHCIFILDESGLRDKLG